MSLVINVKNGLELKDCSQHRGGSGNSSASLEEEEIVNGKPMTKLELVELTRKKTEKPILEQLYFFQYLYICVLRFYYLDC